MGDILPVLAVVVPCYNEEEVLPETSKRMFELLTEMIRTETVSHRSRVVFVDDGSKDNTWNLIRVLHQENELFQGIKLSRNRGHQNALLAGLMTVRHFCDIAISIDADLQDDIQAIPKMVQAYQEGAQIVYGVRRQRDTDTAFKRATARSYYKLLEKMGVNIVYDHADFRLMSKTALDAMADYQEVNLFLRGMVPLLGYKTAVVEYDRAERFAGESKYPLKKMLALAWQGITSFSFSPIQWITRIGCVVAGIGLIYWLYLLISWRIYAATAALGCILLLGGLQLIAIGVVGQYVGKTYMETKKRPRFLIEEYLQ